MNEPPNTVHGRLLESMHLTGYSFERACAELEWLLDEDRWKQLGYDDIHGFLATIDLSDFRVAVEQRQKLAKRLADIQASQRATARLFGVDEGTIRTDLGKRRADKSATTPQITPETTAELTPNADKSAWFQADIDPSAAAKLASHRADKEQEREARRDVNRAKVATATNPLMGGAKFATIVIDPPWDWDDEGDSDYIGRTKPTYASMPIQEIAKHPVPELADVDCHLYLWITNRSLPKGFGLLDTWGFRYVTCLTWCKPSFGMGTYFRGSSEQVLFGVKGSQPLKRRDAGTWFQAARGNVHSAKPDEFYTFVESCSPGPYVDIFGRRERKGWSVWGEEVFNGVSV